MAQQELDEYLTVQDFCARHSSIITMGSLRWILFNSETNGSNYFVRKLGRKLLISPKLFFEWVDSNKRENRKTKND